MVLFPKPTNAHQNAKFLYLRATILVMADKNNADDREEPESLVDADEISPEEEGFMKGYDEEDEDKDDDEGEEEDKED